MSTKTRRCREPIEADEILVQPRMYDGFSVRLVQPVGFKSAAISGAGLGETNLGWTDVGLTGFEENIPVSTDADIGYGNAIKNALVVLRQSVPEGCVIERPDLAVSFEELNELMGFTTIPNMEPRFLTAAQREAKYGTAR